MNDAQPLVQVHVRGGAMRPSRRQTLQWVLAAVAASTLPTTSPHAQADQLVALPVHGYGTDPDLVKTYKPGELWPLTFTPAQKALATSLADTIIPRDALGPAASEVGSVEMLDEWISAPYPQQLADKQIIMEGLTWLEAESTKRFNRSFADLTADQKTSICDDIAYTPTAKAQFKAGAAFFSKFRSVLAGAYFSTPAGWKAVGYVGNVALPSFEGPPREVLEKLGVTQTVV